MSIATERRERTAAEIFFTCRVARFVDKWVSDWHVCKQFGLPLKHPRGRTA